MSITKSLFYKKEEIKSIEVEVVEQWLALKEIRTIMFQEDKLEAVEPEKETLPISKELNSRIENILKKDKAIFNKKV